jgi:hypothetical protein
MTTPTKRSTRIIMLPQREEVLVYVDRLGEDTP